MDIATGELIDVGGSLSVRRSEHHEEIELAKELLTAIAAVPRAGGEIDLERIAGLAGSRAPNTIKAIISDLKVFAVYAEGRGITALPSSAQTIAEYVTDRARGGAKVATIERALSSLSVVHKRLGYADPVAEEVVKDRVRYVRRKLGTKQKQSSGLRLKGQVADIEAEEKRGVSLDALLEACPDDLTGLRDAALLSVGYDAGLRVSELVAVKLEDLMQGTEPDVLLLSIDRSKRDQEGKGALAFISPASTKRIRAWTKAAGIEEGPLFRRVRGYTKKAEPGKINWVVGRDPLVDKSVTYILRTAIERAANAGTFEIGVDELDAAMAAFSSHSLRIGITQDLVGAGMDLAGIMQALRWKSPTMPARYSRHLMAEASATGRLLGRLRKE